MRVILPGVSHWTALHEPIRARVSSYDIESAGVVLDPKVPDDGLRALPGEPQQVVLTGGHHHRGAKQFADAFGIPITASGEAADDLLGAHAERVKDGLRESFQWLLTRDFDHLLFAHGEPLVGGGKAALRTLVGHEDLGQALQPCVPRRDPPEVGATR